MATDTSTADPTAFLHGAVPLEAPRLPAKVGRPSAYSQETAERIIERMSAGETLRSICADKDMPHRATVYRWLYERGDFRLIYSFAQAAKTDHHADECVEIADNVEIAREEILKEDGTVVISTAKDKLQAAELKIKTRMWRCAKENPRKYGPPAPVAAAAQPAAAASSGEEVNLLDLTPAETLPAIAGHPLEAELAAYEKAAS